LRYHTGLLGAVIFIFDVGIYLMLIDRIDEELKMSHGKYISKKGD